MSQLTELKDVWNIISLEQQSVFDLPLDTISSILMVCVLFSLALSLTMLLVQLENERMQMAHEARATKARQLRIKGGMKEVAVPAIEDNCFHLFLSQYARQAGSMARECGC